MSVLNIEKDQCILIYPGQETECPEPLISPDHLESSPLLWLAGTIVGLLTHNNTVSARLIVDVSGWPGSHWSVAPSAPLWLVATDIKDCGQVCGAQPVTRSQPSPQPFIWTCWPWTYLGHILVLLSPVRRPCEHHGCRGRGWDHLRWPGGHQV